MKEVTLIFPNQLFKNHPALALDRPVVFVEDFLFFRIQIFHIQRLVLLRASMKIYAKHLKDQGFTVYYLEGVECHKRGGWADFLIQNKVQFVHLTDVTDDYLSEDIQTIQKKYGIQFQFYDTPMFLTSEAEIFSYFSGKKNFSMASFYSYQRKILDVFMKDGKPIGGKYSFDAENRKSIPKGIHIPDPYKSKRPPNLSLIIQSIENDFPQCIGFTKNFNYPVTHEEAHNSLIYFLEKKLEYFGDYEDAILEGEPFLFHSGLSPILNIGLLTPEEVLAETLNVYKKKQLPINSVEGFIRQIIGWREYMRACYLIKGRSERTKNFFHHTKSLPKNFWNGSLGIDPIDKTILSVLQQGYCHHIQRLMVLGNFMLLLEINPSDVYEWFMAFFVDAYDWVMVPNVYAMSQYADGGEITTKPYISGSNYILKMSHYKKGPWCEIWDGLFWAFLQKHKSLFSKNPRTRMLIGYIEKNKSVIEQKIESSIRWISNLDSK